MNRALIVFLLFAFSQTSFGFFSLMDTGELVDEGQYRVLGEGQILFDAPEGFNLNGRFSTGISEDSEIQFEAGVGSIDYYMGAFWKWVPFPDTSDQPAIGFRGGVTFADVSGLSTYGLNVTPLISKRLDSDIGAFSPYGGLELGLQNNVHDTFFSMQAIIGVQWSPNEWDFRQLKDFNFLIEYGLEVDDAFNYLSLGANYNF